jgi:hypothetical protein
MKMPKIANSDIGLLMQALGLLALLLYLAPAVFGRGAPSRIWLNRAAVATLAVALVIALAASVSWFLR